MVSVGLTLWVGEAEEVRVVAMLSDKLIPTVLDTDELRAVFILTDGDTLWVADELTFKVEVIWSEISIS